MDAIKLSLLLGALLFGAYSQHDAKKMVMNEQKDRTKHALLRSETGSADVKFMQRAIELSRLASGSKDGEPFGCVVVRDGKIVGEGWNRTNVDHDPTAHAEVVAIRHACADLQTLTLKGCSIYTSAQPCPMCLSLAYLSGIEKIFYCIPATAFNNSTLSVNQVYNALKLNSIDRPIPEVPMLQEQVSELLSKFRFIQADTIL